MAIFVKFWKRKMSEFPKLERETKKHPHNSYLRVLNQIKLSVFGDFQNLSHF